MKVTKSILIYPMIPLVLHASAILLQTALTSDGSVEDCGTERPQQENWLSAWTWSPQVKMLTSPEGSISKSAVRVVMFSDGGQASIMPPV